MKNKIQSVGNLIAATSWKAGAYDGAIEENIPFFGRIVLGEIMEFTAIRLFADGREIAGVQDATSWDPWQVALQNAEYRLERSTTSDDCHQQCFQLAASPAERLSVAIDFIARAPLQLMIKDDSVYWQSALGRFAAIRLDPPVMQAAVARNIQNAMQILSEQHSVDRAAPISGAGDSISGRGTLVLILPPAVRGYLAVTIGRNIQEVETKLTAIVNHPRELVAFAQREWEEYFSQQIPPCPVPDNEKLWREAWYVLRSNRMDYAASPLEHPFCSPSKFHYTHQWLWDSAFHSIALRWGINPYCAQHELDNLFENQRENGRICHEIFFCPWTCDQAWHLGRHHFAPTSQPPVLALAVDRVLRRTRDEQWAHALLPKLVAYLDWWHIARAPDAGHLAGWGNPWESGLDNSPRWDHIPRTEKQNFIQPVAATELNALLVQEWRIVASLAHRFEQFRMEEYALKRAASIKAAMLDQLWDPKDHFFYCRDHLNKPIRIKTVGGLLGLLALESQDPQVDLLIGHLIDESEFWTQFPVPSVARNEETFSSGAMWRGPTWINTNWLLIRALERLGRAQLALSLCDKTLQMVQSEGMPKLWEWYDPISGRALGNMDYGWSTLVIDLMMDKLASGG